MSGYILAHDLGTSGNKATLFDEEGRLVASCTETYGTDYPGENRAEQDPKDWWRAVCSSSRRVLREIDPARLVGVSFSGQMMACLCVDRNGIPLRNALIYCDQRAEKQAAGLAETIGFSEFYRITGHRPSSSYSLAKLLWVRENEPEIFGKTYKMLQAKDYMNFRLTGSFCTDFNDASGTNAFDLEKLAWSEKIISAADIPPAIFPEAVASTTVIGKVSAEASAECGIPAGVPVTAGSGDGGCATIGAGSWAPGTAYCYMGSSSWVSVTSNRPLADKQMKTFTWAHPIEGLYQPCGTMQTAGSSINWISRLLNGSCDASNLEELNRLAGESPAGAGGVFFLPYLLGERSPWWDPDARGCFIGMDINTDRSRICRAVIEGIAMNLNESLKIMLEHSGAESVTFIGGGANGSVLRRIFADVFGLQLSIPSLLSEATSMGAALIGGVGTGLYDGFGMVEKMNPQFAIIRNDEAASSFYNAHSVNFTGLYTSLKDSFAILAGAGSR